MAFQESVSSPDLPDGGLVVDLEAREALQVLIEKLEALGLFKSVP